MSQLLLLLRVIQETSKLAPVISDLITRARNGEAISDDERHKALLTRQEAGEALGEALDEADNELELETEED